MKFIFIIYMTNNYCRKWTTY